MKKKFRRNQMFITVLAIMIAAAGYLNYADRLNSKKEAADSEAANVAADQVYKDDNLLNSEDDIESLDVDYDLVLSESDLFEEETKEGTKDENSAGTAGENSTEGGGESEAENGGQSSTETSGEASGENGAENVASNANPGDALFVSNTGILTFVAEAKLSREQARAKSKETLLEIVNNDSISETAKQNALDAMVKLSDIAVKESAAETLLAAKGFTNAVVTIQEGAVDVVVNMEQLSDAERAQIEDIIINKTGIGVNEITIVPLRESEE